MESFSSSSPSSKKPRPNSSPSKHSKSLSRKDKSLQRKPDTETKRLKRAEENKKLLFAEIKRTIESKAGEDEQYMPGVIGSTVQELKTGVKDRRVVRIIYAGWVGGNSKTIQPMLGKTEWNSFVKALDKDFSDNEINDLFLFFCKRLDPSQQ